MRLGQILVIAALFSITTSGAFAGEDYTSPRAQMADGVAAEDVECNKDLQLLIRSNGDAICVSEAAAVRLVEAGIASSMDSMMKGEDKMDEGMMEGDDAMDGTSGEEMMEGEDKTEMMEGEDKMDEGMMEGDDAMDGSSGEDMMEGEDSTDKMDAMDEEGMMEGEGETEVVEGEDAMDGSSGEEMMEGEDKTEMMEGETEVKGEDAMDGSSGEDVTEDASDKMSSVELVKQAVKEATDLYDMEGADAFASITSQSAEFVQGEAYVFVIDPTDFLLVAHGNDADLVGKEIQTLANFSQTNEEILASLEEDKETWLGYDFLNPETGDEEMKESYLVLYENYIFGSGFYTP